MPSQNIITWNFANWVTVFLMVSLGGAIVGVVVKLIAQRRSAVSAPLAAAA